MRWELLEFLAGDIRILFKEDGAFLSFDHNGPQPGLRSDSRKELIAMIRQNLSPQRQKNLKCVLKRKYAKSQRLFGKKSEKYLVIFSAECHWNFIAFCFSSDRQSKRWVICVEYI